MCLCNRSLISRAKTLGIGGAFTQNGVTMRHIGKKTKVRSRSGETVKGFIPQRKVVDGQMATVMKPVSFRKAKSLPKGCKVAKRICIKCLKNIINKNDSNYESKICKTCS